jgi:hypothetical protein
MDPEDITREPLPALVRVHYFVGKTLSADDLAQEQDYRRERSRLHNPLAVLRWAQDGALSIESRATPLPTPGVLDQTP